MSALPPLFAEDHVCPSCGLSYPALSVDTCLGLVERSVVELEVLLGSVPDERLRRRRLREGWSAIEYAAHVRDVFEVFAVRIHRGVHDDWPAVDPMYNDWRATRFGYSEATRDYVLEGMRAGASGFSAEVRSVPDDAWDRVVTRLPGEDRTVRWLVRQAAHEAVHHTGDVRRILSAGPAGV